MEFWLKGTSRVCRGRHGEVGVVEYGLYKAQRQRSSNVDRWYTVSQAGENELRPGASSCRARPLTD